MTIQGSLFDENEDKVPVSSECEHCACGRLVSFFSALLDEGFCSDECYNPKLQEALNELSKSQ